MTEYINSAAQSAPIDVFEEGQWWLVELDSIVANGTPDQKRAMAVVRNLLSCWQRTQSAPEGAGLDGLPMVIAGAIFDFAGFLTTREGVIEVGANANASPVADLIQEWAELRGLSLADASVLSWQEVCREPFPV